MPVEVHKIIHCLISYAHIHAFSLQKRLNHISTLFDVITLVVK